MSDALDRLKHAIKVINISYVILDNPRSSMRMRKKAMEMLKEYKRYRGFVDL